MEPVTVASARSEHAIAMSDSPGDPAGGQVQGTHDEQRRESRLGRCLAGLLDWALPSWRKSVDAEKKLNKIVFGVPLLDWAGNGAGNLAFIWGTVVLLGGFCTLLNPMDFWFSTVMILIEASRVFIREDALVNQWLFGSTRAFRLEDFPFARMLSQSKEGSKTAVAIGVCINLFPLVGRPAIIVGVLKAALLIIISQFLVRCPDRVKAAGPILFTLALVARSLYNCINNIKSKRRFFPTILLSILKSEGLLVAWLLGTGLLSLVAMLAGNNIISTKLTNPIALFCFEVFTAACLACLPFLQPIMHHQYYYTYFSITAAIVLLLLRVGDRKETDNNTPRRPIWSAIFQILDTIQPILFLWALMCPLPGISLKISFYILFPALVAAVTGNLQIPMAFLRVVLSGMRLSSLLGRHHHDYQPLPQGVSPNMVPSIVIFFVLELWQGSSYIMATILGLISRHHRGSLVRASGFPDTPGQWGEEAVERYYHQAYRTHLEKGLFPSEEYTPSLTRFAVDSLGCTSSKEQLVGLHILNSFLNQGRYSESQLTTEITSTSKNVASTLIPGMVKMVCSLLDAKNQQDSLPESVDTDPDSFPVLVMRILECLAYDPDNCAKIVKDARKIIMKITGVITNYTEGNSGDTDTTQQKELVCSSLNLLRRLAKTGGKIGATFRQELWKNPSLLDSVESILDLEHRQPELWEPVMDVIAKLALDEDARQEIGSTQGIICKLMHAFLEPHDLGLSENNNHSLQMAAGEALANLTVMNKDNCWAILEEPGYDNLIKDLINMLDKEYYVAGNLLYNLCADHSRDKLIVGLADDAKLHLQESAMPDVMNRICIETIEGEQLEAVLSVTSQIGYLIPQRFAEVLEAGTFGEELVKKLDKKPCPKSPRMRRLLVEMVICIFENAELCPGCINSFIEQGVMDALEKVKRTPSGLEKYRVFLDGEGVVVESLSMRELVDKAKNLIHQATTPEGQPGVHA